jgi:branched-chain amino acid transport system permease protein
MASLFAVGYVYQRFLIQYAVDSSAFGSILLTFGVALMMHNIMIWVFSPDMKNITPTYAFTSVKLGPIVLDAVRVFGVEVRGFIADEGCFDALYCELVE